MKTLYTGYYTGGVMEPIRKEMWKCPSCESAFDSTREADHCLYNHVKERCINHDFGYGCSLDYINRIYGLGWTLTEKQKNITKDNCFKISYLQCCEKPAYRITHISYHGSIKVYGVGSWSGGYGSVVRLDSLEDPRPPKELFIATKSKY